MLEARMEKDPDFLVDLTTCGSDFEAQTLVEALKSRGIFAQAFTHAGSTLAWENAASQPFRVAVRRADLQRAKIEIAAIKSDSIDIDWDEVDVGQPESDEPRPRARAARGLRARRWRAIGLFLIFLATLTPLLTHNLPSLIISVLFAFLAVLSFLTDASVQRAGR
jgi:hypothetical protein